MCVAVEFLEDELCAPTLVHLSYLLYFNVNEHAFDQLIKQIVILSINRFRLSFSLGLFLSFFVSIDWWDYAIKRLPKLLWTYYIKHARTHGVMPMQLSAKCLWSLCVCVCFVLYFLRSAHTHRMPGSFFISPEITVRMFQILNYYREIILCVVTCCVYNYLFLLHENKTDQNNNNHIQNMIPIFSSVFVVLDTRLRLLRVDHLSTIIVFELCCIRNKEKWVNSMYNSCISSNVKSFPNINSNSMVNFQFSAVFQINTKKRAVA